ncbi:hypothetical protein [Asticcacaulis endophyticus]|uniref:Uncharacterized protein n=1 Tax=Asticcacaulis endophyticus TaxID=1395890 RepID=A0A918UTA1_9CAUL|nr:hypothetical protein [Asticcacaulis endophyticus]GGZ32372.1 hypothetical protein GCM10011273_18130 [Asticcacaulis endophyticus]
MDISEQDEPTDEHVMSLPESFSISIDGWTTGDEVDARAFANSLLNLTRELSTILDLSRLKALIVTTDYNAATASTSHGELVGPGEPTDNEYGTGLAMARNVIIDEDIWSEVVIYVGLVQNIFSQGHESQPASLLTFVHELRHVHDTRVFSRSYPGGWQSALPRDGRDRNLQPIVNPLQSEYCAQRAAAWAAPADGLHLINMLEGPLRDLEEQMEAARTAFFVHDNLELFWESVAGRLKFLFQCLGYALGHYDYIEQNIDEHPALYEEYRQRLDALKNLPSGWLIEASQKSVEPFWSLDAWTGMEIYDEVEGILERLLNGFGVRTSVWEHGIWIEVDREWTGAGESAD